MPNENILLEGRSLEEKDLENKKFAILNLMKGQLKLLLGLKKIVYYRFKSYFIL